MLLNILVFITSVTAFNIMLLYEKENPVTRQAWAAALDFVSRSPLDVMVDHVATVESHRCDPYTFYNIACSIYDTNVLAGKGSHLIIDLTQCPPVNKAAKEFLNRLGLPSVSTSHHLYIRLAKENLQEEDKFEELTLEWISEPNNQDAFVQFLCPQDMVLQIVRILSISNRLSSVGILHDRAFGLQLYKSEHLLRDLPIRRVILDVEMSLHQVRRVMHDLRRQDIFTYFVLGSLMTISTVMDSVECNRHTSRKFYWYLITQENGQLKYSCKNMTALLIRPNPTPTDREKFDQIRSFYSLEAHSEMDAAFFFNVVVKSILAYRSFSQSNSWIMERNTTQRLCKEEDNSTNLYKETIDFLFYFKEVFNPVIFSPLSLNGSNARGYMDFTMKIEQVNGDEVSESIGFWKPTDMYTTTLKNASIKTPRNLYKVAVVLQAPFMIRNIDVSGAENFTGYCVDILDDISHILNFDYEIYVSPDNNFGISDDNGRWNGIIKELVEKNADIGLASLSVTAERENVVDFTIPYYDMVGTTILMKRHTPKSSHFKFLTIIEKDVWLSILVIYMLASFLLWMFDQFNARNELLISEPEDWTPQQLEELMRDNFTLKDFLWFCMTSLTPQGDSCCCTTLPSYITMGTWCLFGLAVISFYTANLAASLTVSQLDTNIRSLSDLAQQSGIQYAPINGSTAMSYFERMADIEKIMLKEWKNMTTRGETPSVWQSPITDRWQCMWSQIQHAVPPANQEDAVARVLASPSTTSGFAYIGDGTNMKYQVLTHCDVQVVGEEFSKLPLAIAIQKYSPLKEPFNKALNQLLTQRRLVKLKEKWWDENPARKICKSQDTFTDERTYLTNIDNRVIFNIFIPVFFIKSTDGNNNISIMIINSADNIYVESGVDEALNYIQTLPDLEIYFNCVLRVNSQDNMNGQVFLDYICKKYEEALGQNCSPDLILDLTVHGAMSEAAKTFSTSLGIPTVAAAHAMYGEIRPWDSLDSSKWLNMVQVSPPANVMLQIIESITRFQKMKNAAIIYDQFFRMDTVTQSLLGDAAIRQVLVKVDDPEKLDRQLTELRELDIVNYYILGSLHTARQVLDSIKHDYYYRTKFAWHIITQDEGSLQCVCKNITVLIIRPVSKRIFNLTVPLFHDHRYISEITFSFYHDLTIRSVLSLMSLSKETNATKTGNNFPKCPQDGQLTASSIDFRTHFQKIEQQYDYGPIVLGNNWTGTMDFEMRLDLVETATLYHKVVGYWSSKNGELFVFENISSLAAKPIYKVAVIVLPPFTMVTKDENGNENYTGYCIDLIDEISQMLGFEYEIYKVPDNTPGTMDEHGKWSGIVKEVLEKRADIGLSSMSVTAERQDVVEFTMPFYDLIGMNILMKKTKPSTAFFKFFSAMGNDVWFCIMVVYIIASVLIWTFEQFSLLINQGYHKQLWGTEDKREFTIKECLWFCMTSLTPQGGGEGLSTTSGRVVAAVWWLFGFILIASYTANLAAFLTVSRLDTSINSLEDLAKQYKVQYAPMNGSQGQTYFQRMAAIEARFQREWMNLVMKENMSARERSELALWQYPVGDKFTKMWKAMQDAGLPLNLQDAVDRVLASKSSSEEFALIVDGNLVKYYSMNNCDLQMVGEEFCKLALAIILQKGSPLTQIINRALAILLHKRRLNQLKEKWWDDNPDRKICPEQDELTEGISIYNIGGVFVVMASGALLACIILFFEYCCPKQVYMRRQSKKQLVNQSLHKQW